MRSPASGDIVVRGVGMCTALGDSGETWDGVLQGRTAIRLLSPGAYAARVDAPELHAEVPRQLAPQVKFLSGSGAMAAAATQEAWQAAASDDVADTQRGLYLAQMDADDWNCRDFRNAAHAAADDLDSLSQDAMNKASLRHVKPFFLLEGLKNNAFSFLTTWLDVRGPNTSTAGTGSLGTALLDMARRAIQSGTLERALLCGAERLSSSTALRELELHALRIPFEGDDPAPLTSASAGFVPGDGAATVVLGPLEGTDDGGVAITGIGSTTCLTQDGQARSEALCRAAAQALSEAQVAPGELTAVVAPGTGLAAEADALAALPGAAADAPVVCFAGATGHTALASDVLDLALAARALEVGSLPGARLPTGATPTLARLRCEPLDAPAASAVLVLSLGMFGHAGAVVLRS